MKTLLTALTLVFSAQLAADQTRTSDVQTWTENSEVYVLHFHSIEASKVTRSETIVINKDDGTEISRKQTAPFNLLVPIADGAYFVGLSDFITEEISAEYNFALFMADGRILSTTNITAESGHCPSASESRGYVSWYSKKPEISLQPDADRPTSVIVKSPYRYGEPCEMPL